MLPFGQTTRGAAKRCNRSNSCLFYIIWYFFKGYYMWRRMMELLFSLVADQEREKTARHKEVSLAARRGNRLVRGGEEEWCVCCYSLYNHNLGHVTTALTTIIIYMSRCVGISWRYDEPFPSFATPLVHIMSHIKNGGPPAPPSPASSSRIPSAFAARAFYTFVFL